MITSKRILDLLESYRLSKKVNNQLLTVYENPTQSEMKKAGYLSVDDDGEEHPLSKQFQGDVRYIADARDKKVYVWGAWDSIHDDVRRLLKFPDQSQTFKTPYLIEGVAKVTVSGVATNDMQQSDYWTRVSSKNILGQDAKKFKLFFNTVFSYDWLWLDKHIKNSNRDILQMKQKYLELSNS